MPEGTRRAALPGLRRWWWAHRTYRTLGPLWRLLYGAFPQIALRPPGARHVGAPPRGIRFRLYRRVIEIDDGLLALRAFLPDRTPWPGPHGPAAPAAQAAAVLRAVQRARAAAGLSSATGYGSYEPHETVGADGADETGSAPGCEAGDVAAPEPGGVAGDGPAAGPGGAAGDGAVARTPQRPVAGPGHRAEAEVADRQGGRAAGGIADAVPFGSPGAEWGGLAEGDEAAAGQGDRGAGDGAVVRTPQRPGDRVPGEAAGGDGTYAVAGPRPFGSGMEAEAARLARIARELAAARRGGRRRTRRAARPHRRA